MKLFLVGMPGSGKTNAAEILKKKFKLPAYDLDNLVEMMEEKTIAEIFKEDGEEAFRKAEAKMLRLFREKKKFILSTGGGTPCFHNNMEWMNKEGITVWLNEPLDVLVERLITEQEKRPLLAGKSRAELVAYLERTMEERRSFYEQAAQRITARELEGNGYKKLMMEYA